MKRFWIWLCLFTITAYPQLAEQAKVKTQINEAANHFRKGNYEESLLLSKKALVSSFKLKDDYLIAHSYNAIGAVYDEFSQSHRAIEFYTKALLYANRIENDSLCDWIYSNLGTVYYYSKIDTQKGIGYYRKSLFYAERIKDSSQITYAKLNIASAYFSIDEYDKGWPYVKSSANYVLSKGQEEARLSYYMLYGIYLSRHNRPDEAEASFFRGMMIAKKEGMDSFLANIYESLIWHYTTYHKSAQLKETQKNFDSINKALYTRERQQQLDEVAMQIELDEYKNQLEKIEFANEKQLQQVKDSKIITILFAIIVGVLSLFVYTLYKNNNARKRLNAELTQANRELLDARDKAEEISRMKTQFVSTISHELRTPLYGVIGITDMFIEEHQDMVNNELLNSLKFSAHYLLELVNDILQLNKIEDQKVILEKKPFRLGAMIATIMNSLHFIAEKNDNTLRSEIDPEIPESLLGDELRLSQILVNLISNALKFTVKGEVCVKVQSLGCEDGQYKIRFSIADNGIGISKDDQEKIFDKFVQVNRKTGDYQGTGLGLAIVKRLLRLFDSNIHLQSQENVGTTFTFDINFDKAADFGAQQTIAKETREMPPLHILVVEDNKINQMVTERILKRFGHHCDLTDNGFDAIEIASAKKYDVILMDINMPMINGFETSVEMRERGITTPIIALTAFDKNEIIPKAAVCGMDGVIIKPFLPETLFSQIAMVVAAHD